jgi:hypothetical protein
MTEPQSRVQITYTNRDVDVIRNVSHAQVLESGVFTANYVFEGIPTWVAIAPHEWAVIEATPEEENNE